MRRISRCLISVGLAWVGQAAGIRSPASQAGKSPAGLAKPVKAVAEANNDFAFDLYQRLAQEQPGKNLFFSPYSVSVAMTLAAEGARGETAEQMGRVLRYPPEAKRTGERASDRPWRMETIHQGMSALRDRFNGHLDPALITNADAEVSSLRAGIEALKGNRVKPGPSDQGREAKQYQASIEEERKLVGRLNQLLGKTRQYELKVANSLWAEKTYSFKPEFFAILEKYHGTGLAIPADFRDSSEAARLRINGWVEDRTEKRIKDLIPGGGIDSHTRLVLVNAVYFKGGWSVPFKERHTKGREFTRADGGTVKVPTLHALRLDSARYAAFNADGSHFDTPRRVACGSAGEALRQSAYPDSGGFSMVELAYKGGELSMVVLVPDHPALLAGLEKNLARGNLVSWLGRLQTRKVEVFLPKFKVESSYSLGDWQAPGALQKMGMPRAFMDPRRPDGAQFDGMSESPSPGEKLHISKVVHKAFVEVDEKGTEAAAATAVIVSRIASGSSSCDFTPQFRADRPFLYLIRDRATGTILFLGRMMDPS